MRNKKGILFLTIIITLICLFYLSFSFKFMGIEKDITAKAEQRLSDSAAVKPNMTIEERSNLLLRFKKSEREQLGNDKLFLGKNYNEIKEYSLNLGLDLQGGIHTTVTIDPVVLVQAMAGYMSNDAKLLDALKKARKTQKEGSNVDFVAEFYSNLKPSMGNKTLYYYFRDTEGVFGITSKSTDDEILAIIRTKIDDALGKAVTRLRARFDRFGASQASIIPNFRTGRIEIQLPGVEDTKTIKKQITTVAELNFCKVYNLAEMNDKITKIDNLLKSEIKEVKVAVADSNAAVSEDASVNEASDAAIVEDASDAAISEDGTETAEATVDSSKKDDTGAVAAAPDSTTKTVRGQGFAKYFVPFYTGQQLDPSEVRFFAQASKDSVIELFKRPVIRAMLGKNIVVMWENPRVQTDAGDVIDERASRTFYFVEKKPLLSGDVIKRAGPQRNMETGQLYVSMSMNAKGTRKWAEITREYAKTQRPVAIVLDSLVLSAPNVQSEIAGGESQITLGAKPSFGEVKTLSDFLEVGKLPTPLEVEQMVKIGGTLGQEAIDRGLISMIAGLGLVIIFMVLYYNKGGLIANVALFFNILFIIGVLSMPGLGATLTLSGIAGIVLTMGMAIDANVLIFERIREEIKMGKNTKAAIASGYQKAFWTIVDSNVTTLITAIILAKFGTGLVQGFAVTLIIGICCSFFSSVYITRLIIEMMTGKKEKTSIAFSTGISKKLFQNVNRSFISKRKVAYAASGLVIAIGLVAIFMGKLNLGVEFSGGRAYILKFDTEISSTEFKEKVNDDFKGSSMIVKNYDSPNQIRVTTSYAKEDADDKMLAAVNKNFGKLNPKLVGSNEVGASIADDIKRTSVIAIVIALIAIFIYILIRFLKWQFSLGAIIALFHDVLVVLSVFAIAGMMGISFEIDEIFVAAMLTIVGYSINDTVVVFDRVREHLKMNPKMKLADNFNSSINSTMSRTLMTSFTTLLVVIVLFIFGGEALRGFSFALLIGILVGTYSSIFIATPVVLDTTGGGKKIKEDAIADAEKAKTAKPTV